MVLTAGPDATSLLSTALEKLLYLESRLEAAESAREQASRDVDRLRSASSELRKTLADWQRRATHAEVAAEGAEREAALLRGALEKARNERVPPPSDSELAHRLEEANERLERFERERELWLDRMIALGRLRSDSSDELDLGSFISELRAELMALRRGEIDRRRATIGDRPAPPDARALLDSVPAPKPDVETLVRDARLPKPQRTLAILCARDLESESASVRRRAVERLAEARIDALNPFIVECLREESDAWVRTAMVVLLDRTGGEAEALVIDAARQDDDTRVRAAAVEALARRGTLDWVRALNDDAPAVRRRVLALLPRTLESLDAIDVALRDDDASVRKVAALALANRTGSEAVALLRAAASSTDEAVATVAREALDRRGLPFEAPEVVEEVVAPTEVETAPEPVAEEPAEESAEEEPPRFELDERIMDEVRGSLRGRAPAELEVLLGASPDDVAASAERLVGTGIAVWRGPKLYPA